MLNPLQKKDLLSKANASLIIFLYLTQNFQAETEVLRPFLQNYGLSLQRLKGKHDLQIMFPTPVFYKNANFFIHTHQPLSFQDCISLSQFLLSKVKVLSFSYNGHMWNTARLKQLTDNSSKNTFPMDQIWKSFQHQNF